jgi:hypothetical protein
LQLEDCGGLSGWKWAGEAVEGFWRGVRTGFVEKIDTKYNDLWTKRKI